MKKYLILIMSVFIILTSIFVGCAENSIYPRGGKDSEKEFGDSRFIILVGHNEDNSKYLMFYDNKEPGEEIDGNVKAYKDIKPFAYIIGEKGFIKTNYESGEIKQSMSLDDFEDSDKEIFKKLELKE